MPTAAAKAKKITVDIPRSLYQETEQVIRERHTNTSTFVREAIERYLEDIRKKTLEKELAEGYVAYASLSEQIHNDFAFVDAELTQ